MKWGPGFNPTALRTAKTLQSFGHSECNRVKVSPKRLEERQIKPANFPNPMSSSLIGSSQLLIIVLKQI